MRDALTSSIETLEAALSAAAEFGDPETLAPVRALITDIRSRSGFLGRSLVVALAGGTGTGKSSLLNALAGAEISEVGPIRPTTDAPVAWVAAQPTPELLALLDQLEVVERVPSGQLSNLAIIDFPDFDSTRADHREAVQRLIPRVDLVLWVAEGEKYNDRALHDGLISTFLRYQGQFVFVMNQADVASDPEALASHWREILEEGGLIEPRVITCAARPGDGTAPAVQAVRAELEKEIDAKGIVAAKLASDLLYAGDLLAGACGVVPGTSLDYRVVWERTKETATSVLVSAAPDSARHEVVIDGEEDPITSGDAAAKAATAILDAFVGWVVASVSPRLRERIQAEFPARRLRSAAKEALDEVESMSPSTPPRVGWVLPLQVVVASLGLLAVVAAFGSVWAVLAVAAAALAGVGCLEVAKRAVLGAHSHRMEAMAAQMGRTMKDILDRKVGIPLRDLILPRGELASLLALLTVEAMAVHSASA